MGGVLANSRNHHIGPTAATSSGDMFLRLYRYTGQAVYLHVLQDIVSGLPQYLCIQPGQFGQVLRPGLGNKHNVQVRTIVNLHAAEFAEASPYPTVADITKDIYWEEDHPEKKVSQGRIVFD